MRAPVRTILVQWLHEQLPNAPPPRRALLRHACRTLLKQGQPQVLKAWGLGRPLRGQARLALSPRRVALGQSLQLRVHIESSAARAQTLLIDYAVHHVKASGALVPKVFKGWRIELGAHESRALTKRHALREITTRRYHPGRHEVDLRINGRVLARASFELSL
jgi:hypothetical protein